MRNKVVALLDDVTGNIAWYLNGVYQGHDDQITPEDVSAWLGGETREFDSSDGFPDCI